METLKGDILNQYVEKIQNIRTELNKKEQEMIAVNEAFNDWIQKELGVTDSKRTLHLGEILKLWSDRNGNATKPSSIIHNA